MTEEKIVEFFNKVKGKKIMWSTWPASDYVVPHALHREPDYGYYLVGSGVCCGVMDFVMSAYVQMGFDKDDLGNYWDFYELAPHINDNLDEESIADTTMPTADQKENKILSEKVSNLQKENDQLRQRLRQLESLVQYEPRNGKLNIY